MSTLPDRLEGYRLLQAELERRDREAGRDRPLTDAGNAERFTARHGQRVRYVHKWGRWLLWDDSRWAPDDRGQVRELMIETARSLLAEAALEGDADVRARKVKHALKSERRERIMAALDLASSQATIAVVPDELDTDPWLLNVENGTIDLRTGELRPHVPGDLITKLAPVAFDPDASAPRWDRFLEEVLPSPEVRAFVQRAAGYTITGSTRDHCMFLPVGGGRNGKGVLMRCVLHALGDYGRTAAGGLLLERHGNEAHLTELASLDGARFVFASEVPPHSRWNEPRLKQLTGGDPVTARFMRQDEFTFLPKCKVWLAMNERPKVVGTSDAIWSRLKEIPFPVQFRDADDPRPEVQRQPLKDPRLEEELLASALPAVLAWAVAGALAWQRDGLGEPPEVRTAVQDYRTTQDRVGPFLAEHPVTEKVRLRELFKGWTAWCTEENERSGSQADLAAALRAKGYVVKLGHGKVTFVYPIELPLLLMGGGAGEFLPPDSGVCTLARARDTLIPDRSPATPPLPRGKDGPA